VTLLAWGYRDWPSSPIRGGGQFSHAGEMVDTYAKPFLEVEAQLDRLRERGLRLTDPDLALRELQAIALTNGSVAAE
jgi:hypothetical protein